jgi:hypothetical protein
MAYIEVEVDLEDHVDELSDETIRQEFYDRGLGNGTSDSDDELRKAHRLHWQGKRNEAYEVLWEMCLIRLNKVV